MNLKKIKPKNFGRITEVAELPHYPSFNVSLKDLPIAKDWKVGQKYSIEMEVRQSQMYQSKNQEGNVTFEILKIAGESLEEELSENEKEDKNYSRVNR